MASHRLLKSFGDIQHWFQETICMEKETWSLFPYARWGLRRVREAVLVTRQKTPNATTTTNRSANVAEQKDRGTYHPRGGGFVGFVKRSSSPAKKPPTHRPNQSLSKRRRTKGPRNVPSARGGRRRVREAVLVTRQKTPNATTTTNRPANVAKQKDRGTYHPRGGAS